MSKSVLNSPVAHTPNTTHPEQWHDLKAHLRQVAQKAATFAEVLGAQQLAYYAGLWHDLGKYNPEFQEYLQRCHAWSQGKTTRPPQSVPHAIHGAKWAFDYAQDEVTGESDNG